MDFLGIYNFKCFLESTIQLNKLTVFAGANGNGKSTAVQAILFLRSSIENHLKLFEGYYISSGNQIDVNVPLNDSYMLALGNSASVINRESNDRNITLSIFNQDREFVVNYLANESEPSLYLKANLISQTAATSPILKKEFYYLNAERVGPRINQKIEYYDFPHSGCQGELTAQLISERSGYLSIDRQRAFMGTSNLGLEFQVNEWLNYIMPGVRVSAKSSFDTQTAQIRIENSFTKGDPILATNIGFGISYILPIIANGLVAEEGSYLIVENPEAHLHPSAQTRIGVFLAMVAKAGVHVIIETHSDHLINGLQIAALEGFINSEDITINYFNRNEDGIQPEVLPILFNTKAELSDWPLGFFDQTQIDYSLLYALRKRSQELTGNE